MEFLKINLLSLFFFLMKIVCDFGFLEGQAFFRHDLGMNYCAERVGRTSATSCDGV